MASSAGILMYRRTGPRFEVPLVHPGGPFWRNKDDGAWSIPKGEMDENEDVTAAARREFLEETGCALSGPLEGCRWGTASVCLACGPVFRLTGSL
jgi:predicted NUDIX family NTP pyrophosphohydrolase